MLADLACIPDPTLRERREAAFVQDIENEIAALSDEMARQRWPRVVLAGFGGVAAAALTTGVALLTGGAPIVVGLAAGAGLLTMGPAGFVAADAMREPRYDRRRPLAYAALAKERFGS